MNEVGQRQENAKAAIKRAEAAVELARLNLSYTVVTAPCDGCLGRRSIEEGQLVNAGQTLTTIIPDTRKWVVANYKETQVSSLSVGQEVEVQLIDVDYDKKRISLSMKALVEEPADEDGEDAE